MLPSKLLSHFYYLNIIYIVLILTIMYSKCNDKPPKTKTKFQTVYDTVVCILRAFADTF